MFHKDRVAFIFSLGILLIYSKIKLRFDMDQVEYSSLNHQLRIKFMDEWKKHND
jgi:hypothetical protein